MSYAKQYRSDEAKGFGTLASHGGVFFEMRGRFACSVDQPENRYDGSCSSACGDQRTVGEENTKEPRRVRFNGDSGISISISEKPFIARSDSLVFPLSKERGEAVCPSPLKIFTDDYSSCRSLTCSQNGEAVLSVRGAY